MYSDIVRLVNPVTIAERNTADGTISVLNNRVAIRISEKETCYIDVVAWGGLAEIIAKYFKKGDELFVEGELKNKESLITANKSADGVEKKFQTVYLLIKQIKFTHGNKKEGE